MRKIGTYLRSFWQSIKDKPFVYCLLIISVMLSVVVSAFAYRGVKETVNEFENRAVYAVDYTTDFDCTQFYNDIKQSNVINVRHSYDEYKMVESDEGAVQQLISLYSKVYVPDKQTFSHEQLENSFKEAVITSAYAKKYNITIGNTINVLGTNFSVIKIMDEEYSVEVFIPATVKEVVFEKQPTISRDISISTKGNLNKSTMKTLRASGFDVNIVKLAVNGMAVLLAFIGIILISIAAINIFIGNRFITDKNSKRYSLYRVVGAKNRDVAMVMFIESLLVVIFAFCVGAIIEHFAFRPILNYGGFVKLGIGDYAALFFINVLSVFVTTAIVIFKKLYSAPMDAKQRGKQ